MLDRTAAHTSRDDTDRRRIADAAVATGFLGLVGLVMMGWIAGMGWMVWKVVGWTLF